MSVREIKAELDSLGVPYGDVTEKSELLHRLEEARRNARSGPAPGAADGAGAAGAATPGAQRRSAEEGSASRGQRGGSSSSRAAASDDTVAVEMRRILELSAGDHYAILEVPADADAEALKRAYRKKALRLHPDKCRLAGAAEAFKRVSAAYAVLSDPQQRRRFDFLGPEQAASAGGGGGVRGARFMDQDAEDLFRAFFGSGASPSSGSGSGPCSGGGRSSSSTAVDAHEGNLVQRLMRAFVKNPWTLVTLLSGLAPLISIIEMLSDGLGIRFVILLPMIAAGIYACPSEHRRIAGMVLVVVLFSGFV